MVPPKSTLMISYVGYREVRMPLGNRRNVTVEMPEDTEYLDDVVVIGYGTQKKSDLTHIRIESGRRCHTCDHKEGHVRVKKALGEDNAIFGDPSSLPYTDWTDEIYRNGIEHSYNLSLSGGSGKIRYYAAGAYERENGTQSESWWERISARVNVDYAVNKSVNVGTRVYFARIRENPYILSFPWVSIPYITVTNPDGSWTGVPSGVDTDAGNPRADIAKHHFKSSDLVGNADLFVDWNIWDGFKLSLTGAAHLGGGYDDQYTESSNLRRTPESDSYYKYQDYSEEYTFTSTLSYGKKFAGKHDFYAMVGFEAKTADEDDHLANNPLLYERWAEMFGEMRWWEDVRRLRIGQKEADYYKTVSSPGAAKTQIVWKETNYAMPIPASEFESNPSSGMVQTPGY